jgi:hypothetical protein
MSQMTATHFTARLWLVMCKEACRRSIDNLGRTAWEHWTDRGCASLQVSPQRHRSWRKDALWRVQTQDLDSKASNKPVAIF